ncbi:MAG: cytochrome-c peroxidase [Alphaproteobacteria bacterium]|nr:cytochrome-c peroxidase [Alphaproteobacteria bacterium]
MIRAATLLAVMLAISSCAGSDDADPPPSPAEARALFGRLGPAPQPEGNPSTPARVRLGRALFGDPRLSADGSLSCQSCHRPDQGFAVAQSISPAFATRTERRKVPTLINVAFKRPLLWDGRVEDLDLQPLATIADRIHFNNDPDIVAADLTRDAAYPALFREAFGVEGITAPRIAQAIAAYERTLVFDGSRFDRYMDGDTAALTAAETRGLALFAGKAACAMCHNGPNLTDDRFHNIGVPDHTIRGRAPVMATIGFDAKRMGLADWASVTEDLGRQLVTKAPEDGGKFRTMSLRNVAQVAPYMHNGAFATLAQVIDFYDAGGGAHPNKSGLLRPLGLTAAEKADLEAFLRALTGSRRPDPG